MSEPLNAYQITERLHAAFFEADGILDREEVSACGVLAVNGTTQSPTVQRLEAYCEFDGRPAKQTFSKSNRGDFYLSTTFLDVGGRHIQSMVSPSSPPEALDPISSSVFMQRLIRAVLNRS
jgi:hypothetical protein